MKPIKRSVPKIRTVGAVSATQRAVANRNRQPAKPRVPKVAPAPTYGSPYSKAKGEAKQPGTWGRFVKFVKGDYTKDG